MPRLPLILVGLGLAFGAGYFLRGNPEATNEHAVAAPELEPATVESRGLSVELVPEIPRGSGNPLPAGSLRKKDRPRLSVEQALRRMDEAASMPAEPGPTHNPETVRAFGDALRGAFEAQQEQEDRP